ncbi:MAG TPA: bi-domain-containing oxidoreductase [Verrucomicrobiae bacterium]|nr:bi-domain-containing oxidoreductase [Verrucomicrobiae bacterium]
MKQLVQDFKSGAIKLVDVPAPALGPGSVRVRNAFSLVSAGTERATVNLAQQSLVGKARSRPDLVRRVVETAKREGISAAVRKVQSRLDQWKALGYSCAGTILEVGEGVTELSVGDRVACGGQDYASHAEEVVVPQHLCAKLPEAVRFEHAAFGTLGAIAMQGVRQADARVGESVAVIGLGLVGQLTVQILKAAGCVVLGIDVSAEACELARRCGCDAVAMRTSGDIERSAAQLTNGFGVDAAIITAAAPTSDPVELAAKVCRERGRVVMVGVTGMELPRDVFYEKELEFKLSRSYGPGRYDPLYEEKGVDYPIGYVRWTEQRNMEAFVQLLAGQRMNVAPLITHTFPIVDAPKAYELITGKTNERCVGVLLEYPRTQDRAGQIETTASRSAVAPRSSSVCLGVIGAGNYAQGVLLPRFKASSDVTLRTVCTSTGVKAEKAKEKFGFETSTTNWRDVLADKAVNTVVIATRHDLHAEIAIEALRAGKTVFCEKPLCLRAEELDEIADAIQKSGNSRLMVGFNRRFAPFASKVRELAGPLVMRYRVSVQPLPADHWINDPQTGGGRILGEVCHFIDFLRFAARSRVVSVFAQGFGGENVQVAVRFADGSVGSIDYFNVADADLGKEHFEAFGGGRHIVVDEFRDKGQAEEVRQFVQAAKTGGPMPIPLEEIMDSSRATLAVPESIRTGRAIEL